MKEMTNKEAINELETIKAVYAGMRKGYMSCVEALDMAIKALENSTSEQNSQLISMSNGDG